MIIMIIMVMILYFFASYSLYVALCFSVVNKSKAPSHLLSAPRSPAVADSRLPQASGGKPLSEELEGGAS